MEEKTIVGNEIAVSMSSQITSKVQRIRELKDFIAERLIRSGVAELEAEIETNRAELLVLTREYKDLTGENWADDTGYARYRQPGEAHSYDVKGVDEALASLLALSADMETLTTNNLTIVVERQSVTVESLIEMMGAVDTARLKLIEELTLRLNKMDVELKKLAAARKVSDVKESVAVK